jgi:bifunctional UDP-N-acetylglucosamine pyrophosphorylase / glucosamine-1-phosphate N-acetyltransferase
MGIVLGILNAPEYEAENQQGGSLMNVCAVVLAAGEGKRMKSGRAKVVHEAAGKPLVVWVRDALGQAGVTDQIYVVGHRQEEVRAVLGDSVAYAVQAERLGTGHAVLQAGDFLQGRGGCTLILCGDAPLIRPETLRATLDFFAASQAAAVVITGEALDPTGYGRVIRDETGAVQAIVEQRDASPEQLAIHEINAGMYCFDTDLLLAALAKVRNENNQNEYYLTDTIGILIGEGRRVEAFKADFTETLGVNNLEQLAEADRLLAARTAEQTRR